MYKEIDRDTHTDKRLVKLLIESYMKPFQCKDIRRRRSLIFQSDLVLLLVFPPNRVTSPLFCGTY